MSPLKKTKMLATLLKPRWSYPAAAGALVAALVALACVHSELWPAWMSLGIAAAWAAGHWFGAREEVLWSMSSTDVATGLVNRRHFQATLDRELAQMFRTRQKVALLLFDLDHLKAINDRFGHVAGDVAIRAAAKALKNSCRAGDLVARWGGDEFAVVAACESDAEARALGARLCQAVRNASQGSLALSVSGGVALADPERKLQSKPSALFAAADRALYKAKAKGGGQFEVAGTEARLRAIEVRDLSAMFEPAVARKAKRWPV
ncbi:MAG: GGDEF domain-containing protein [Myxococcaceae bacterium]